MNNMARARARYRLELKSGTNHGLSFRGWARRTYNPSGATGKLAHLVRGRA